VAESGTEQSGPGSETSKEWKQYTIDLNERDLGRIKSGFFWSLAGQGKPLTFYLDDIQYK
jgi:hypothetical protein